MAGRYYYRPAISSQDGLGVGIGRGLAALGAGFADRRQRKKDEALDRRKQSQQDALFDIELAGMGGGRGYAPDIAMEPGPTLETGPAPRGPSTFRDPQTFMDPGSASPPSQLLDPRAWLNGPSEEPGGPGLRMEPAARLDAPVSHMPLTAPDPRYRQLGNEDMPFYIQDPEYRAGHVADTEFTRKRREAGLLREDAAGATTERVSRIAASLQASDPEMSDAEATGQARLMVEGNAPYSVLNPRETFTPREGPEGYYMFGNEGTVRPTDVGLPPSETNARGVTPTSEFTAQAAFARQMLGELNFIDRQKLSYPNMTGAEVGMARQRVFNRYGMDEKQARALVLRSGLLGDEGDLGDETDMETPPPPAAAGAPRTPAPPGGPPPGAGGEEDPDAPLNEEEIRAVTIGLAKTPRREWAARMKAKGFTQAQINQVFTGRQ